MSAPEAKTRVSERLIQTLGLVVDLDDETIEALRSLPLRLAMIPQDGSLVREGDDCLDCCVLMDGFVCRFKNLCEGRRQILSFHFPGEIPDLPSLHLEKMDYGVSALTPAVVAYIPRAEMTVAATLHPPLARALWRATQVDASIFREWLAGAGRRSAAERAAHLFCEIAFRMRMLALTSNHDFYLPVTQSELGDALGLSVVHINRVLQKLRREGLIAIRGGHFTIEDWRRLKALADFDSSYLHFRGPIPADLR